MLEAENEIGKVKSSSRKGDYGDTNGKSANSLYKSYKNYMISVGKSPLSFPDWIKWAKEKGIVDKNINSDGEGLKEEQDRMLIENAEQTSARTKKIVGGIIIFGMACFLGYKVYNHFKNKSN